MDPSVKMSFIPEITNERLHELAKEIKPMELMEDKTFCFIKPSSLYNAFMWIPEYGNNVPDDLVEIFRIDTLHKYGYYGFFKPSIEEVLAQIQHLPFIYEIVAFRLIGPTSVDDLNSQSWAINWGGITVQFVYYILIRKRE